VFEIEVLKNIFGHTEDEVSGQFEVLHAEVFRVEFTSPPQDIVPPLQCRKTVGLLHAVATINRGGSVTAAMFLK
jgi:hypothetical protein